jgi:hypothetical protein
LGISTFRCARTVFEVAFGIVQWNLDGAKVRRQERERRRPKHQE